MTSKNLIALYCGRTLEEMQKIGGSGHWKIGEKSLKQAEYVLFIRNRNQSYSAQDVDHGTAFMLAKVDGTFTPSEQISAEWVGKNRKMIHLQATTDVYIENAWKLFTGGKGLNPVVYLDAENVFAQMNLDPNRLIWQPFEA